MGREPSPSSNGPVPVPSPALPGMAGDNGQEEALEQEKGAHPVQLGGGAGTTGRSGSEKAVLALHV